MKTGKLQMQEMEQLANAARGLPPDQNSLHRLKALGNSGINIPMNNTSGKRISSCLCCTSQQHDYANEAEPHGFRANQRHNPLRNMNASPRYKGTSPLLLVLWGALQSGVFLPICLLSGKCKSSSYSLFTVMWLGSLSELVIHVMFLFIDLLSKLHPGEQWPTITKQMK